MGIAPTPVLRMALLDNSLIVNAFLALPWPRPARDDGSVIDSLRSIIVSLRSTRTMSILAAMLDLPLSRAR